MTKSSLGIFHKSAIEDVMGQFVCQFQFRLNVYDKRPCLWQFL